MNDNLAKKYNYYQVNPTVISQDEQLKRTQNKKKLTQKQIIARRKARLKRKKQKELRKKLTLIFMLFSVIFGTLGIGLCAFFTQK